MRHFFVVVKSGFKSSFCGAGQHVSPTLPMLVRDYRNPLKSSCKIFAKPLFPAFTLCLVLSLAAVGSVQAAMDEKKALNERATAFWQARVAGDWGRVFEYAPQAEQQAGSKEQFIAYSKENGPFNYLSFKVGEIEIDADVGWVKMEYTLEPMRFKGLAPQKVNTWQIWEKIDGKWSPMYGDRQDLVPKLPPSLRSVKEESAVMARADEFWKAREKNDYAAVYRLCAPAFREKVSSAEFLNKKAMNIYVDHQIHWAEVKGDHAQVKVTISFRPNDPSLTKMDPAQEAATQNWIKVNGQWYLDARAE
jgi:hypothetical protein